MPEAFDYPVTFTTARLRARRPRIEDVPAIFAAYASDPEVTRYLSWRHYNEMAPLQEFVVSRIEAWKTLSGHLTYVLEEKGGSGSVVGSIGFERDGGKVMFGYVLARSCWGRGYMAEALTFLTDWALGQDGIFRAWAFCDTANLPSARVMEKAGMTREGLLRRWHRCPELGPELRDCLVYAKVR